MANFTVESVLKYYNNKVILNDIYISLSKGEILCIVGKNGAGKTTLLNIISGIDKNSQKHITYNGKILQKRFFQHISYSSQDIYIPDNFKVRKLHKYFKTNNTKDLFNESIFIEKSKYLFGELSTGERKYIQSLLNINSTRKICLLDEPFGYISPIYAERLIHYIKSNKETKIFIITTHLFQILSELDLKTALLKDGKLHKINDISKFNLHY